MRITADADDSPEFVRLVERLCLGVLNRHAPTEFVLIKIDNWFGSKWLGFSGKTLGAVGVWNKPHNESPASIRIPPFVPNRVIRQRRFSGYPNYNEGSSGIAIHVQIPSDQALTRRVAFHAPQTALAWYSGNSASSGRGALMSYVPCNESYWAWYADWKKARDWELRESWDIKAEQIGELMKIADDNPRPVRPRNTVP
jgi:hypothetical protein